MKTCCEWFRNTQANIGQKGFGILPFHDRRSGRRQFYLQARPYDPSQVKRLVGTGPEGLSFAVFVVTPLRFCPSCGTELAKLISKQTREFDAAAALIHDLDDMEG
jgi:hypothetical protein